MRQHEDRHVIGWILAPPSLPVRLPWTGPTAEHVSAHDYRANVLEHLPDNRGVCVDFTALLPLHFVECRELDRPVVQRLTPNTERFLHTLVRPGDVAVERHGNAESYLAHFWGLVEESIMAS